MLDENLPAFFLRPSGTGLKHHYDFLLSYHGSDPAPAYLLQHADPASPAPAQKNCYAAALFDAYNPEVLFGEVLARPAWTQPTLSQEDIARNGGVPAPPQPILPTEFTIQLYNPDQQVRVDLKEGKWGASDSYEFSMPISTFRTPSASTLDRGQSDPASLAITPKVHFVWRRESKLSKDLTCFMTGRSTDIAEKKKSRRDPDIAIALWRSMREMTIYEPNLQRVDMEDPKGLEVTLLLSAVVIKDLYFSNREHLRETFNVSDVQSGRKLSGGGRKVSNPSQMVPMYGTSVSPPLGSSRQSPLGIATVRPASVDAMRDSLPRLSTQSPQQQPAPPPIADPRAQWELEAETARLKAHAEAEARAQHQRQREREKADEQERRRLQKMVEAEEKEARKRQAEVDKETDRLRRMYGMQALPNQSRPQVPARPQNAGPSNGQTHSSSGSLTGVNGLHGQSGGYPVSTMMSGGNPNPSFLDAGQAGGARRKKSFFGLRSEGTEQSKKLSKKPSTMW
nr:hypothetical protein CFP56_53668 [Quercus suber]